MPIADRVEVRERKVQTMVATKTTTVTGEDGKPEHLKALVTFIHDPRHWLVQTYPDLFTPAGPARTRAKTPPRRRAAARAPSPARPPWKPLVRLDTRAAPTFTVRIREDAYHDMADQAFSMRTTGFEIGGGLFGAPVRDSDTTLTVRYAGEPGPGARTSPSGMRVDCEHIRREASRLKRTGSPVDHVGHWHTHPSPDASGEPSPADLQFFAWDCREWHLFGRSMQHHVGLILTPKWDRDSRCESYVSWAKPNVHAWHMQAVSDDQFICTRAKVVRC